MTVSVYGIKNCTTVKKALQWLAENGQTVQFHDYKTEGAEPTWLAQMADTFGWETLVNKKSTTWRNLDENVKNNLNQTTALDVLHQQPTLIKRPIVLAKNIALIGFNEADYQQAFK